MVTTRRYVGLDVLRFLAAFAVMSFHLGFLQWSNPHSAGGLILADRAPFPSLAPFTMFGYVGVEVFFVISGFVISFSANNSTAGRFARSRFLRLYPGALVCATLTFAAIMLVPELHLARFPNYVKSIVLWPVSGWVDRVYWTLGVELAFYAFVFAHLAINRFRWFEWTVTLLGLGSCAAWGLYFADTRIGEFLIHNRYGELMLAPHGLYFALGALIWIIMARGANLRRILAAGLFTVAGAAVIGLGAQDSTEVFHGLMAKGLWLAPCLFWLACLAGIIASVKYDWSWGRWESKITVLGLATYPLYLVHYRVGALVMRYLIDWGTPKTLALPLTFGLMIATAIGLTLGPERLARRIYASLLPRGGRRGEVTEVAASAP